MSAYVPQAINLMIDFAEGIRARVAPGGGDKVLWVHGYTVNSSVWIDLWSRLPAWHHFGIDLPGHGKSAPSVDGQNLASLGRALGEAARAHDIRHVVGLSLGSMVALQIVMEFPRTFSSLLLGAPALGGGPTDPEAGVRYKELLELYHQRGAGPWMTELWMTSPPAIFTYAARHRRLWEQLKEVIDSHSWEEMKGGGMRRLARYPQPLEKLREITAPTLILVGEHEMAAFKQTADLLRESIPTCEVVYLPDTGHLCMLEAVEASAGLINVHLNKASA